MNAYPQWIWIAIAAVVILVVIGLIAVGVRRSRTAALRRRYGTEYDYAVRRAGSRTAAEEDLSNRAEEARQFDIHPLRANERDGYRREWRAIETRFVDRPATAVVEAEELITSVMRAQGYPMADFEKYASLLSVEHPRVVEHFRAGHQALEAHGNGAASTEELRQAMLHFRALFEDLVGSAGAERERPSPRPEDRA